MPDIKLQSSDGEDFEVDVEVAKVSMTIREMLENLGSNNAEEAVPLPSIDSATFLKVIEWATYHKDDPPPPPEDHNDKEEGTLYDISSWDADFLKEVDQCMLAKLMLAADYLNIQGLLNVTCKTFANKIRGKLPEEIRNICGIVDKSCEKKKQM